MRKLVIIFLMLNNSILYAQVNNNQSNKSYQYLEPMDLSITNCNSYTPECTPLRAKDGSNTKLTGKDFNINYDCDNGKRDINSLECITVKRRIYGK